MKVLQPNNVKIYNLSAGRSLPNWVKPSQIKKFQRSQAARRQIELIQDYDMPDFSTSIRVSKDAQYIIATGMYPPTVKCFDVNAMTMKFSRGYDAEAITHEIISDDFRRFIMLQHNRYIEVHDSGGVHYRLRIPKFGTDLKYHTPSCELYISGVTNEIYRLNLEKGMFSVPLQTKASVVYKLAINPAHHLVIAGTQEGKVLAYDPRTKDCVGILDCGPSCFQYKKDLQSIPYISALEFNGALEMGVGTSTGQVLLYDIRSYKPFTVKDHMYSDPIKDVKFHYQDDLVFSMDKKVIRIWNKNDGKLMTSINSTDDFNNLCLYPKSGMFFATNEGSQIGMYYIPTLGPAPRWAAVLDSITEELEEQTASTIYDDYKFISRTELEELGLDNLIGTPMLRGYMHGYFINIKLYQKAKSIINPFAYETFRKEKIREKIETERANRVQVKALPKINREYAKRLLIEAEASSALKKQKTRRHVVMGVLKDERFKNVFENANYEVDPNANEYKLIRQMPKELRAVEIEEGVPTTLEMVEDDLNEHASSDEDLLALDSSSSDDEVYQGNRKARKSDKEKISRPTTDGVSKQKIKELSDNLDKLDDKQMIRRTKNEFRKEMKMITIEKGQEFKSTAVNWLAEKKNKNSKIPLGERLKNQDLSNEGNMFGAQEITFTVTDKDLESVKNNTKR